MKLMKIESIIDDESKGKNSKTRELKKGENVRKMGRV